MGRLTFDGIILYFQVSKFFQLDFQVSEEVDVDDIATKTKGYAGSDLKEFCRYAALNCLRRQVIDMDCATLDG